MTDTKDKVIVTKLYDLLDEILNYKYKLEDKFEITAILESKGWTDSRAAKEFGTSDVFDLATDLWLIYKNKVYVEPADIVTNINFLKYIVMILRSFLKATIFTLPIAISVFALLTIRFMSWSAYETKIEIATNIAFVAIMSFFLIGLFTQTIARRGFMYVMLDHYNMARKITSKFISIGYYTIIIITALFIIINLILNAFTIQMMMIVLYFFFLSSILLSLTVMYILEKEFLLFGLVLIGIIMAYILFAFIGLNIVVSQLISLFIISIICTVFVRYIFSISEHKIEKGVHSELPLQSYIMYGFLFFLLLFIDRIIAFSTNNTLHISYLIWFKGEYELGLDFALLMLIVPMGLGEVIINKLIKNIAKTQKSCKLDNADKFNIFYYRKYLRILGFISLCSIICSVLVYLLVNWMKIQYPVIENSITHPVFIIALIAYTFISIGLMNIVILFSISHPYIAAKNIFIALIVNIIVGLLLSIWIDYHLAVIGLLAGSIVFMILMTRSTLKVIKKLDFYVYSAS